MKRFLLTTVFCLVSVGNATLIGHWGLDEESGIIAHDSLGAHDGALINYSTNSWTSGQVDGALKFDGVNDYVKMGNVTAYENLEKITISAWINLGESISGNNDIFGKEYVFKIGLTNQKPRFLLGNNWDNWSGDQQISETTLSLNQWYHIAATYDGQYKRIYIDGLNTDTMYAPIVGSIGHSTYDVTIGAAYSRTLGWFEFFDGKIDDVRIYNNALSAAEIRALAIPEPTTILLIAMGSTILTHKRKV